MCSNAYYNKSSKVLEVQKSGWYNVSFNLSNDALFELIEPGKSLAKLSSRQTSFHKFPVLFGLS